MSERDDYKAEQAKAEYADEVRRNPQPDAPRRTKSNGPMSLRDRIAAAIYGANFGHNDQGFPVDEWNRLHDDAQEMYLAGADAVIAELRLRKERVEAVKTPPKLVFTRYVTNWKADDE